jgi:hypothetical protein
VQAAVPGLPGVLFRGCRALLFRSGGQPLYGLRGRLGALHRGLRPALERLPIAALAIVVALAIRIAVAIPKAPVITPEGPVVTIVVVAAVLTRLLVALGVLRG